MTSVRYVTKPRNWSSDDRTMEQRLTAQAVVPDLTPVYSGLLDANGDPLYRVPETVPLGFQSRRS